jgi:16S rRNA (adenine1518-N6/adenine1519-N6)-dimethyltransferase
MLRHLAQRFPGHPNLRLVHGDARDLDIAELTAGQPYNAIGNLPYFAANPIIRRLLESPHQPGAAVVMVQKEVAREIAAPPGKNSLLSISIQVYAEAEYLFDVHPEAFDPPPSVMSGVVRLVIRGRPLVPPELNQAFFDLVARTFRNPRKQVHNALSRALSLPSEAAGEALVAAGIEPSRRPETLSVEEWLRLLGALGGVPHDA